jgi:DNA repair photolyase
VTVKEINAKTILRKHKKIDSWFLSKIGMNLYRGCTHNCGYCDGRNENYNVKGKFGYDVSVKVNAIEILKKELNPNKKILPGYKELIMLGGGVGDSYQPIEEKYRLTRKALKILYDYDYPVSILTKSTLIQRDIDLIKKINNKSQAIVGFSFSSVDDKISKIFEPYIASPSERLKCLAYFKKEKIPVGMFLMPVIPFISDNENTIEDTIKEAKKIGVDFIIFSGMTLKLGKQRNYFMDILKNKYPKLENNYKKI